MEDSRCSRDRDEDRRSKRDRDDGKEHRHRDRDRERDRERSKDRDRERSRERDGGRSRHRSRDRDDGRRRRDSPDVESREARREREAEERRLRDEKLREERERLKRQREIDDLTKDQRTIFVSQLTKKTDEKVLEKFFNQIGVVNNIIMLRDRKSGHHKGFAYVEMSDLECIPNCLLFNNVVPDFQKFPILVKASEAEKNFLAKQEASAASTASSTGNAAAPPTTAPANSSAHAAAQQESPDSRMYVGNIHISIDDAALKTLVEQFGPVENVRLQRDHLGNSKGFAFVKFIRSDSAARAMAALAGVELAGRVLKVGPVLDSKTANDYSDSAMQGGTAAGSALVSMGGMMDSGMGGGISYAVGGQTASANWKLDADEGSAGLSLNAQSRQMLMAKLGKNAGLEVPLPTLPPNPLTLPMVGLHAPAAVAPVPPVTAVPPIVGDPSNFLLVMNMFDPATETEADWELDVREDVLEECSKHGAVVQCHVETKKPGGMVFLKLSSPATAEKVAKTLHGRYFAGRLITTVYLDQASFETNVPPE